MRVITAPPDPEKLESHLDDLRSALERARKQARDVTDPERRTTYARRLRSYRAEIRDLEHDLAKLRAGDLEGTRWERRPMEELTRRAVVHHLSWDPDADVQQTATPGLPLLVPNVPTGLPSKERARREAAEWRNIYVTWANVVADGLYLKGAAQRGLQRVADREGLAPGELKREYARAGLLEAMAVSEEPWSGRLGSGLDSGKVEQVVPRETNAVGYLAWLAQEARRCAKAMLRAVESRETPGGSDKEVAWPEDPETGELLPPERLNPDATEPGPDEALVAEESANRATLLARVLTAASAQQRRIILARAEPDVGNLVDELAYSPLTDEERALTDHECESWADVGRLLDLSPGQVRNQVKRLRRKLD